MSKNRNKNICQIFAILKYYIYYIMLFQYDADNATQPFNHATI